MQNDIDRVLICPTEIASRVKELAAEITEEYDGKKLTVICLSNLSLIHISEPTRPY